jgi:hypothetical protein
MVKIAHQVRRTVEASAGTKRYQYSISIQGLGHTKALVEPRPAFQTINTADHIDNTIDRRTNARFRRNVATPVDVFFLVEL